MKNLNEVSELIDNIIVQKYIRQNSTNIDYYKIGHPDVLNDIRPIEICDWDIDDNNKIQFEKHISKEELESDDGDIKIDLERIKKYEDIAKTTIELDKNATQPSQP
jgi:hypothetical protein